MKRYNEHPRPITSATMRELTPQELAVQRVSVTAPQTKMGKLVGACIVAVQIARKNEY